MKTYRQVIRGMEVIIEDPNKQEQDEFAAGLVQFFIIAGAFTAIACLLVILAFGIGTAATI